MLRKPLSLTLFCLLGGTSLAFGEETNLSHLVGQTVYVTAPETYLYEQGQSVQLLEIGGPVDIERVEGDRIKTNDYYGGWLKATNVLPMQQATEHFDRLVSESPTAANYVQRGVFRNHVGKEGALDDLREAVRLAPEDPQVLVTLSEWLCNSDSGEASELAKRAIELDPRCYKAHRLIGDLYTWYGWPMQEDRYPDQGFAKAVHSYHECLKQAEELVPARNHDVISSYVGLGHLWFAAGGYEKSAEYRLVAVVLMSPERGKYDGTLASVVCNRISANTMVEYGLARKMRGDYAGAIQAFEKAIANGVEDGHPYESLARLLATCPQPERRDGKRAVELATLALSMQKKLLAANGETREPSWCFYDTLATAHAETGDFEEALKWLNVAEKAASLSGRSELLSGRRALFRSEKAYQENPDAWRRVFFDAVWETCLPRF